MKRENDSFHSALQLPLYFAALVIVILPFRLHLTNKHLPCAYCIEHMKSVFGIQLSLFSRTPRPQSHPW